MVFVFFVQLFPVCKFIYNFPQSFFVIPCFLACFKSFLNCVVMLITYFILLMPLSAPQRFYS